MTDETRYWLLTGEVPSGPATVAEIHGRIAEGTMTWQTKVCRVGETAWVPFIELSDAKPVMASPVPNPSNIPVAKPVRAQPIVHETPIVNDSVPVVLVGNASRKPANAEPQFVPLLILVVVVLGGGYFVANWLWPMSAREVCDRFNSAQTASEAKKYVTPHFSRAVDEVFRDPQPSDPNDSFEWTSDAPVPGTNNQYYVGCKLRIYDAELGRRVPIEGVIHCLKLDGWKVNDFIFISADGHKLPQPISLAAAFPNSNPIGGSTPAPSATTVKEWYEKPENRVRLNGGMLLLFKASTWKYILAGIAAIGASIIAWFRHVTRNGSNGLDTTKS